MQEQWRQRLAAKQAAAEPEAPAKLLDPETAAMGGKKLSAAKHKFSGSINAKQPPTMPTAPESAVGCFETETKKQIETTIAKMFQRHHYDHNYPSESDGWQSEETDDENDEGATEEDRSESSVATTTSSCCSSPTPRSSPKRSPLFTKKMKKIKKRADRKQKIQQQKQHADLPPKVGDIVVTETTCVYSTATVVWQDGSIEEGISSRQLYPIHHLDEHVSFSLKCYYQNTLK